MPAAAMQDQDLNYEIRSDWAARKSQLTREAVAEIVDECLTQPMGDFRMRAKHNLSTQELEDLLLDESVERCPGCRVIADSHALVNDHGAVDGKCTNCRASM
jgi:ligand-binding SRPBCC domain-containing protein